MISISRNIYNPKDVTNHEFTGPLIDFLQTHFPNGFGANRSAIFVNRKILEVENYDYLVKAEDHVVVIPVIPDGTEGFWIPLLIDIIAAAIVAVATYYLTPKPTNRSRSGARRVFEIGSGQNTPALGESIVEHFGKLWFYPDVASQPYVEFVNNEQYVNQILLVGAGEYEINSIKIGNTELSMIPPGLVEYTVFQPADHKSQYGVIQAATGIYEDVVTSVDVKDLDFARNANESFIGRAYADDNYLKGDENVSGFSVGDVVTLLAKQSNTDNANHRLTTTITGISGNRMYLQTLLNDAGNPSYQAVKGDIGWRGWFSVCPVGKATNRIDFDFNFPQGLVNTDSEGRLFSFAVTINIEIQQIDDNNNNVGGLITRTFYVSAATRDPIRRTFSVSVPAGRYKVRAQRDNADDVSQRSTSRCYWYGLKAFIINPIGQYAYGPVTLMTFKIRASEALSSSSDKIMVQATRILPTLISDFSVKAPTVNPVDAFAAVVRESDPDGLDIDSLKVLHTRWAGTNGFNWRFEDQSTVFACLQVIAAGHRATPTAYSRLLSMRPDEAKPVDQFLVTQEQIIADSYKVAINIGPVIPYVDGFRVKYRDPTGTTDLFVSYPSASITPIESNLDGCTDQATALAQAQYLWARNNILKRVITFSTEFDSLAFSVGDRIAVLTNVIDNARTCRVLSVSPDGLTLTVDGSMDPSNVLVMVRSEYGEPSSPIPATINGNVITLSQSAGFDLYGIIAGQENTSVVLGIESTFRRSYVVSSITPSQNSVEVESTTYSDAPYAYPIPGEVIA